MTVEREVRYLVTSIDPDVFRSPCLDIVQGYFMTPDNYSLRVRIVENEVGERRGYLTRKEGRGIAREEDERNLDIETAEFLLQSCPYVVTKTRYCRDGWEVDVFRDSLTGLILAEFEHEEGDEIKLPRWLTESVDVTNSLTNLHLARISHDLQDRVDRPVREFITTDIPRIVVTGGPCSGKTTALVELARRSEAGESEYKVRVVPEAATIVFGQLKVRPSDDPVGAANFQKGLYQVIRAFEEMSALQAFQDGVDAVVFDRGTLDGAAFLEGGVEELTRLVMSSREAEYARYSGVVCLEVAPEHVFEEKKTNNPERTETYEQAVQIGDRLQSAYSTHPNYQYVRNQSHHSASTEATYKTDHVINSIDSRIELALHMNY